MLYRHGFGRAVDDGKGPCAAIDDKDDIALVGLHLLSLR